MSQLFTDVEYQKIVLIACAVDGGASEQQIAKLIDYCEESRSHALILDALLSGHLKVSHFAEDNEPMLTPANSTKEAAHE